MEYDYYDTEGTKLAVGEFVHSNEFDDRAQIEAFVEPDIGEHDDCSLFGIPAKLVLLFTNGDGEEIPQMSPRWMYDDVMRFDVLLSPDQGFDPAMYEKAQATREGDL